MALSAPASRAQDAHHHHAPAAADDRMSGGCDSFKWPLDKERAAFADAKLEQVDSGAKRAAFGEQALALKLQAGGEVAYVILPEKKKESGKAGFGGVVSFAPPAKAGSFQVTLSGPGWIDVVQGGKGLSATDHSGAKKCEGLRKSVRFDVEAQPVVLQISGAPADTIKVAVRPAE